MKIERLKGYIFLTAALLILSSNFAFALSASSVPTKFPAIWANTATCGTPYTGNCYITNPIPTNSQIGVVNCAASLATGFPPNTWPVPGGCPPFGQDFNGILYQLTAWAQWQSAGGPVKWDSAFSTAIGGYPNGAVVSSATTAGLLWLSTADNNTSNPDTGGANWSGLGAGVPTGTLMPFAGSAAPPGYFLANGQAVSRTTYAALFAVVGTTYGTGDGSTTFNVPDLRGRLPAGNDVMSASAANRLTTAGSGCAGATTATGCGAQNETLAQANLGASWTFSITGTAAPQTISFPGGAEFGTGALTVNSGGVGNAVTGPISASATNSSSAVTGTAAAGGSGTPVETVQPTLIVNYIIKF